MRPLRIALLGSRGIPARYGGYETLLEELAVRLVESGHEVTVYCRSHYTDRSIKRYRGVNLVVLPTIRTKHLDTPVHTLLSCMHAVQQHYNVAIVVNSANALFVPMLRAAEIPTALHVDGIERQRAKWGRLGRGIYRLSERWATVLPDVLITDAQVVKDYYWRTFRATSTMIAYGVEPRLEPAGKTLESLGVEARRYFLYVSRFEPENNPHRVAQAYRKMPGDIPLVMVGGAPYAGPFIHSFITGADERILFPGPIYGRGYRELLSNALAYIHATEVGGTHPALVEAMGYGNCVIVNDTPENREVVADRGLVFEVDRPESLVEALGVTVSDPDFAQRMGESAQARCESVYRWDQVSKAYETLCRALASDDLSRE